MIGLTGGIASGKSTAANRLRELGAFVADADIVSREVIEYPEVLERIRGEFGGGVFRADGSLDRRALAALAFSTAQGTAALNAAMHPAILKRLLEAAKNAEAEGYPLVFADGRKVSSAADWAERRREILAIFAKEMYGAEPPAPETFVTDLVDEKDAIDGHAVRRQYRMWFKADRTGPCITWIMWIPKAAKKPVPVISFLNYRGNHELVPDEDIPVQQGWTRAGEKFGITNHTSSAMTRGVMQNPNKASVFPVA